ncbi:MAG: class I SAM-dependent methyltransferase [Eubacterium aggregans]|uniref:Methyltransferase domain-containing protein n=1 Tax=Eubacterium aggregans TaxID=81409 RepID=A0A1H4DXL9_9FIRM|nr:class I SAM-dependent methyltransferase [Eubacterium aggregans]MEA5074483.1 class I SAM-dependent methyltransferase [Eubacterium aggregans]SEA77533.1 Methyltransferase domain-containing protein [Eubacterium aggregans]
MKQLKKELSMRHGGRVLDIATRYGEFAFKLKDGLMDYTTILAVDCDEQTIAEAKEKYPDSDILFDVMDGGHLDLPENSMDTVCLSNSIHHVEDVERVFSEMLRVLKPGGTFIVNEMPCDGQEGPRKTHVSLHHLGGEIDTLLGQHHGATWPKAEIIRAVAALGLENLMIFEDEETDSIWDEKLQAKAAKISDKVEKVKDQPQYQEFKKRAAEIEAMAKKNGIKRCRQLVLIGEKSK